MTRPVPLRTPLARRAFPAVRGLVCAAVLLGIAALPGCYARPTGSLTVTSLDEQSVFAPALTTLAYLPIDPSTAEVYLSDIPAPRFADPKDTFDSASGSIVHIHLFLIPSAGDTPIDSTACNVTLRHLVLAQAPGGGQALGLYGGGGFVLPWGDVGDKRIAGSIDQATHRLLRATPNFKDRLGPGSVVGGFDTPRDDALARAIAGRFETLLHRLPPPPPSGGDAPTETTIKINAKPDAPNPGK